VGGDLLFPFGSRQAELSKEKKSEAGEYDPLNL